MKKPRVLAVHIVNRRNKGDTPKMNAARNAKKSSWRISFANIHVPNIPIIPNTIEHNNITPSMLIPDIWLSPENKNGPPLGYEKGYMPNADEG